MAQWYRNALAKMANKEADWDTDSLVVTLHTSTYTPNLDTHAYVSDLTNEVSGTGYTTGGSAITSRGITYTAANSWGTIAAVSTAYAVDWIVRPSAGNGYLYRCAVAGTSGGSAPTWPTVVGTTVTDGTVTWECVGKGVVALTGTLPVWASSTITARYGAISDRTSGTAATQPLLGLMDFGSDKVSSGGPFTLTASPQGLLLQFVA